MFDGIVDFVIALSIIIAVLLIVVGGIMYITSAGNPGRVGKAQSIITSTLIGLLIIFAAWLLVNTVFSFLNLSDFSLQFTGPGKWFMVNCPVNI